MTKPINKPIFDLSSSESDSEYSSSSDSDVVMQSTAMITFNNDTSLHNSIGGIISINGKNNFDMNDHNGSKYIFTNSDNIILKAELSSNNEWTILDAFGYTHQVNLEWE